MTTYIRTPFGKAELKGRFGREGRPIVKDGIKLLAKSIKARVRDDHQVVGIIDGDTGSGKSNLAIHVAQCLDPDWDLELFYIYEAEDIGKAIRNINTPYPVFLFDEGSILLNSKDSMSRDSKKISKLFDSMRYLHVTSLICCPNAMRLNKSILFDHTDFRLMCPSKAPLPGYDPRGFVHVHSQWHAIWTDKMSWPYIYTTSFPKMSKSMALKYDALKRESSRQFMDEFFKEGEK